MSKLASSKGELYVVASPSWQSEGGDDPRVDPGNHPGDDRGDDPGEKSGEDPDTSWGQDPVEGEGGDVEVGFRLSGGGHLIFQEIHFQKFVCYLSLFVVCRCL